jgi:hypothetical protein
MVTWNTSKNDRWRSLGVLEVEFKAVKEGEGKNKHDCCKTVAYTKPTIETLPLLYLGTPTAKALIWQQHDAISSNAQLGFELQPHQYGQEQHYQ